METGWMLDNAGVKQLAINYQLHPRGRGDNFLDIKKSVATRNTQIAAAEGFERGTSDFSAQVLKLKNAGCDMAYTRAKSAEVVFIGGSTAC